MNTYSLINVVKLLYPVVMFFYNRYFPTGDQFYSEEVLIEMMRGNRKIAPFIVPYVNGIPQEKSGYKTFKYEAPYIGLSTIITPKDLKNKAFGEDPNSNRSPADRLDDLESDYTEDMRNKIFRTKELMCIELLMTGKLHIKQFATAEDVIKDRYTVWDIQFYDDSFRNQYVPTKLWASMTIQEKIKTLNDMARILKGKGITATDLVMGSNVSSDLFSDKEFLEYFDYKAVDFGAIAPEETPEGVTYHGTINILGVRLNFFTYDEKYTDLRGHETSFIPPDAIFMLKPAMGTTPHGEVTFVNADKSMDSYAETIVPRVVAEEGKNYISVEAYSRPLPYPKDPESWLYFDTTTVATE